MPRFTFDCDDLDAAAIHAAVTAHQRANSRWNGALLPEHTSDTIGATIAELCRGWLDARGQWPGTDLDTQEGE